MLAHVWSHRQKISQESNYPDVGQDKWDSKKHVEKGREDKCCKTWPVRGMTGGQGGTVQLFCPEPKLQHWKRSLQEEFKEVSNVFWLPPCHKPSYTGSHIQGWKSLSRTSPHPIATVTGHLSCVGHPLWAAEATDVCTMAISKRGEISI